LNLIDCFVGASNCFRQAFRAGRYAEHPAV
jgi:hypothetical protein